MAILTREEILALLADNNSGDITEKVLRDIIDSIIGIGGTMYCADQIFAVTTNWQPFNAFTGSIDTKGINEDLATGEFILEAGADGVYAVDTSVGIFSAFSGWVELAVTLNGVLTPYHKKRSLLTDTDGVFGILATGNVVAGDRIGLAIRASGAADITVTDAQYRAIRV